MDTHKKIREHISTLSDGELSTADLELALAALQSADGQLAWHTYHRIGDVLRAQATPELSDAFAARLAVRLAGEPAPLKRHARPAPAAAAALATGPGQGSTADSAEAKAVVDPKPAIASVS